MSTYAPDRGRPWPTPRFKAFTRLAYVGILAIDLWPPMNLFSCIAAAATFAIWMFLEWVWLAHWNNFLARQASERFVNAAETGAVSTHCPKCGEDGIELREFFHHLRLMHPDVELDESAVPRIVLSVPRPPLWVRLW